MKCEKLIRDGSPLSTAIIKLIQAFNPNYSKCSKCKLPWNWCDHKVVMVNESTGIFATCNYCWKNSTLDELKQYYTEVYRKQVKSLIGTEWSVPYSLEHLLECVEKEYLKQ